MRTNRPDIAKAAGLFIGAILCLFVLKFMFLLFTLAVLLITTIKNI